MTHTRQVEKQPILDRYIPAHPVDRYTFKKWNTDDWFRLNENKYFQSEQDRGQVGALMCTIFCVGVSFGSSIK